MRERSIGPGAVPDVVLGGGQELRMMLWEWVFWGFAEAGLCYPV